MSLIDVLPVVRSLSQSDKVQLVQLLIEDLSRVDADLSLLSGTPQPVWLPEDNSAGAAALQRLLDQERDEK